MNSHNLADVLSETMSEERERGNSAGCVPVYEGINNNIGNIIIK